MPKPKFCFKEFLQERLLSHERESLQLASRYEETGGMCGPSRSGKTQEIERSMNSNEVGNIRRVFREIDVDGDQRIDCREIRNSMMRDGIRISLIEVKNLLWEVDHDLDGSLTLSEFEWLYVRAKYDRTASEPRGLYNYVLYRMMDKDRDGSIQMDEMYSYLCHLIGSRAVAENMQRVFGQQLYSTAMAEVTASQWLRILQTNLWRKATPITDLSTNRPQGRPKSKGASGPRVDCKLDLNKSRRALSLLEGGDGSIGRGSPPPWLRRSLANEKTTSGKSLTQIYSEKCERFTRRLALTRPTKRPQAKSAKSEEEEEFDI